MSTAPELTPTAPLRRPGPAGMSSGSRMIANEALRGSVAFKALSTFGDFYTFVGKVFRTMFTTRFRFREFVSQAWFVTTVSFWPALLVAIPFCVVIIFQVNQLLIQIGAVDLAGAGAAAAARDPQANLLVLGIGAGQGGDQAIPHEVVPSL